MNCKVKCAPEKRKTIYTERLLLREMTGDDFADYFNHLIEADEVLFQYGMEPPEEQLEEYVIMCPEVLYYSIVEKASANGLLQRGACRICAGLPFRRNDRQGAQNDCC